MGVLADWQIEQCKPLSPIEPGVKREGKISWGLSHYGYDIRAGYKFKIFTNVWGSVVDPKNFDPKSFVEVDLTKHTWDRDRLCHQCRISQKDANYDKMFETCLKPAGHILIPPNSFALAESIEEFNIPRDVLGICMGKSTYARCGIIINVTPLEPEWRGRLTIEISNTTPLPAKVYAGEGIAQVYFLRSDGVRNALEETVRGLIAYQQGGNIDDCLTNSPQTCRVSYADKKGKYNQQTGLTLPKVD